VTGEVRVLAGSLRDLLKTRGSKTKTWKPALADPQKPGSSREKEKKNIALSWGRKAPASGKTPSKGKELGQPGAASAKKHHGGPFCRSRRFTKKKGTPKEKRVRVVRNACERKEGRGGAREGNRSDHSRSGARTAEGHEKRVPGSGGNIPASKRKVHPHDLPGCDKTRLGHNEGTDIRSRWTIKGGPLENVSSALHSRRSGETEKESHGLWNHEQGREGFPWPVTGEAP